MQCPRCQALYEEEVRFCPADGTRLRSGTVVAGAPGSAMAGRVLDGRYRLEHLLGEGAMGEVYAGRHVVIDKRVAVKVLKEELGGDAALVQRFVQEARAVSRIGHPNIIDVTDFGRHEGRAYFVMELLGGRTLADEISAAGALEPRRAIAILRQVCDALQAAHDQGIVHRDLKPENIFLVQRPERADLVKVLDFGVAKFTHAPRLTAKGAILGTPEHMSPEQALGRAVDHRSDVYSAGVILYEMLTGRTPFTGKSFVETVTRLVHENPVPPRALRADLAIPAGLEGITLRALDKDAARRPQSMRELGDELDRIARELSGAREPAGAATRPEFPIGIGPRRAAAAPRAPAGPHHGPAPPPRASARDVVADLPGDDEPAITAPPLRRVPRVAIAVAAAFAIAIVALIVLLPRRGDDRGGSASAADAPAAEIPPLPPVERVEDEPTGAAGQRRPRAAAARPRVAGPAAPGQSAAAPATPGGPSLQDLKNPFGAPR